jgi:hypothetical protein
MLGAPFLASFARKPALSEVEGWATTAASSFESSASFST